MGWEEYNQNVYIERKDDRGQKVLPQIYTWADTGVVEKNIWTIVAPPGMGKTWLLRAVLENWEPTAGGDPARPDRVVIQINVPNLINRSEENDPDRMFDLTAALLWLKPIVEKAQPLCSRLSPFDQSMDPSATIDAMVAALCDQCYIRFPPIVIVDRYDELTKEQAEVVSERILEPFVRKACVHMLIARRSDFALQGYALRNPHVIRLQAIESGSVDVQFEKFVTEYYRDAIHLGLHNLTAFMKLRPHYQWNHPYINAFLFNCALSRPDAPFEQLVTRNDILQCCRSLVDRPNRTTTLLRQQRLAANEFDCLKQIAQLPGDDWTSQNLEDANLGFNFNDDQVRVLFKRGLIFNVKTTQRYKVAVGLRELLREL